jgi:3-isopropylmalate dehydrogenase
MKHKIAVIPGDGLGPEITDEAVKVLKAVGDVSGITFQFKHFLAGGIAIDEFGVPMPEATLAGCKESESILFGSVGGPKWDNEPWENINDAITPSRGIQLLREKFELFANLRPAKPYPCLIEHSPIKPEILDGADVMVVREQCGGLYFGEPRGISRKDGQKRGFNTLSYTESEVERVARFSFELARKRRKHITSVDKHNVMESSILWRSTVERVAEAYPDVTLEHLYADNAALQLVLNPRRFDVVVTGNLFGDILSDLTACYHGSLGMMPSASLGAGAFGLYEPIHGSAPDIAGQKIANPIGSILSAKMMIEYSFGHAEAALLIEKAVEAVLGDGYRTADIYSSGTKKISTDMMGDLIAQAVRGA